MPVIGDIIARMRSDDSSFKRGVESTGKWSKAKFAAIGAAAGAAFAADFGIEKIGEIITMGNELKIFSRQAGISTEQWQRLNNVIEKANGDASDSVSIMLDLKRAMADARSGKKEWVDRFALFGVTMEQIKKDDPVGLFESLGIAVARTTELTGEQVDALGKMMGEDTSARAIAAFRNNFEKALASVNVLSEGTIDNLVEINAEIQKLRKESNNLMAGEVARNKELILNSLRDWETIKRESTIGGAMVFNSISKNILTPGSDYIAEAIRFYFDKNWTKFDIPVKDASPEFKRREEIMGMIVNPSKADQSSPKALQEKQLKVLEQIRDKTGSGASIDASVMGGL